MTLHILFHAYGQNVSFSPAALRFIFHTAFEAAQDMRQARCATISASGMGGSEYYRFRQVQMACLENLPEEAESQNIISVPSELMKSVSSASSCLELTVGHNTFTSHRSLYRTYCVPIHVLPTPHCLPVF